MSMCSAGLQELARVAWPVYVTPSCLHLRNGTRVCAVSLRVRLMQCPVPVEP